MKQGQRVKRVNLEHRAKLGQRVKRVSLALKDSEARLGIQEQKALLVRRENRV